MEKPEEYGTYVLTQRIIYVRSFDQTVDNPHRKLLGFWKLRGLFSFFRLEWNAWHEIYIWWRLRNILTRLKKKADVPVSLSLSLSLFRYIIYIYRNTLHRTRNGGFFKETLNSQCSKWKMCSNNFQDEKWERANFLLKQKSQTNLANRIFMISNATCFVVHHRSITHPLFRSASECRFQ